MSDSAPQPPLTRAQTEIEYTALSPLGGQIVHIRFSGQFHGEKVIWDTRLITLQECYQQAVRAGNLAKDKPFQLFQFIEIECLRPTEMSLTIGIDVPVIDAPTVLKCIIMIHNYKRLRIGRHEYGPPHPFP